jgi:hypothetical protein
MHHEQLKNREQETMLPGCCAETQKETQDRVCTIPAPSQSCKEQTEQEANLTNQNQAQKAHAQQQEKEMSITAWTSTGQLSGPAACPTYANNGRTDYQPNRNSTNRQHEQQAGFNKKTNRISIRI